MLWYEVHFEWWLWMEWQVLKVTEESLSIYHITWSQDNSLNLMTTVIQWEFLQSLQMFAKQNIIWLSLHIEKKLSKTFAYIVRVLEKAMPWPHERHSPLLYFCNMTDRYTRDRQAFIHRPMGCLMQREGEHQPITNLNVYSGESLSCTMILKTPIDVHI